MGLCVSCPTLDDTEISEDAPDSSPEPWGGPSPSQCHICLWKGAHTYTALSLDSREATPWPGGVPLSGQGKLDQGQQRNLTDQDPDQSLSKTAWG